MVSSHSLLLIAFGILFGNAPAYATRLPVKAKLTSIAEPVWLSGNVSPESSEAVSIPWPVLIRKIFVSVGQSVKKGDVLAVVETEYLTQDRQYLVSREALLKKQLDQAQFDEEVLGRQQARVRDLASKSLVPKNADEEAQRNLANARFRRLRAQMEWENERRRRIEVEDQIRVAQFYAPQDGVVTQVLVNPTQLVGALYAMGGETLARVEKPGHYLARAVAIDTQVAKIKVGDTAKVFLEGQADPVEGKVVKISRAFVKERTDLFEVEVRFAKEGILLPRDLLSRIELNGKSKKETVTVPWNAVWRDGATQRVTVLKEGGGSPEARAVELGVRGAFDVEILKGLKADEIVEAEVW